MKNDLWYDFFLKRLYEKYPKRSQLTEALVDLLSIEREAVYRRLRKDVLFSIYEVVKIAGAWNISLDNVINISTDGNFPLQMKGLQYVNPSKEDYETMESFVEVLNGASEVPESEYMEICNTIPSSLFSGFSQLAKFYTFEWAYNYGSKKNNYSFNQIASDERMRELEIAHHSAIKNIANVHYIWDKRIIEHLVDDIKYYASIYKVTPEEVHLLKDDIHAFLDYMEDITTKGYFPETNNSINLYISQTNVDTGYGYYSSNIRNLSMIRTFIMNVASSEEEKMFENLKSWIYRKKRSSVQISGVDEKRRIDFFMEQRRIANTL
jgi:hypothetical protein